MQIGQTESVLNNNSSSTADTLTTLDALGRLSLVQVREQPGSSSWDTTEYLYNPSGRVSWTTLPYVGSAGSPGGSLPAINYRYDALGRYTDVDGSAWGGVDTHYSYNLNDVTVSTTASPAQSRQYQYDAAGNMTSVCEITSAGAYCGQNSSGTGYQTKYQYDQLGDLTGVTQDYNQTTTQTRTYSYDGLKRLSSESNPETGTVNYFYDGDSTCGSTSSGDLVKKIDNAGNTTCFYYDGLHRVTAAGRSGPVCRYFTYDAATVDGVPMNNVVGRMAEAKTTNCGSTQFTDEGFGYSPRGEPTYLYESTPHSSGYYEVYLGYWPNGAPHILNPVLTGIPNITFGLDGEGRISSLTASSGQNPVTGVSYNYAPSGYTFTQVTGISGITYGSGDSDSFAYDTMSRMTQATYNVGTEPQQVVHNLSWNPNSTLSSLAITDPLNSQNQQTCGTINYDALGRLTTFNCTGPTNPWQQSFTYDTFGNITKDGTISWMPSYNQPKNQYVPGGGISYDANGNLLTDTFNTYTWDPNWGNPATVNGNALVYDALGRMVENTLSAGTRQYVYAPGGSQVLAQMNGQSPVTVQYPLPSGGLAMYDSSANLTYSRADWLGSGRLVTDHTQAMVDDSAYAPFGEQYQATGTSYDFTGQQQWTTMTSSGVTTAGIDDFPFRKYHPTQGRWISPDPAGLGAVDISNPQTWNRYAYLANNPLNAVDPLGLDDCASDGGSLCDDGGNPAGPGAGGGGPDYGGGYAFGGMDGMINLCTPYDVSYSNGPDGPSMSCGDFTWYLPIGISIPVAGVGRSGGGSSGGGSGSGTSNETLGIPNGVQTGSWGILSAFLPSNLSCPAELSSLCSGIDPALDATTSNGTPWYQNTCITSALLKGTATTALDAVGVLVPAGGAIEGTVAGAFSLWHGAAGVSQGRNIFRGAQLAGGIVSTASAGSDGSGLSAGLGAAGIAATLGKAAPLVGQVISGFSMVVDIYQTAGAIAKCN